MMDADIERSLTWAATVIFSGASLIRDLTTNPSLPSLLPRATEHISSSSHPESLIANTRPFDMTRSRGTLDAVAGRPDTFSFINAAGVDTDDRGVSRSGESPQSVANDGSTRGHAGD